MNENCNYALSSCQRNILEKEIILESRRPMNELSKKYSEPSCDYYICLLFFLQGTRSDLHGTSLPFNITTPL